MHVLSILNSKHKQVLIGCTTVVSLNFKATGFEEEKDDPNMFKEGFYFE